MSNLILYVRFKSNNLKAYIKYKDTGTIKFKYDETGSDAMIIKPAFFESGDKKIKVVLLQLASEFSWGQKVVLIKNDKVYDGGFWIIPLKREMVS